MSDFTYKKIFTEFFKLIKNSLTKSIFGSFVSKISSWFKPSNKTPVCDVDFNSDFKKPIIRNSTLNEKQVFEIKSLLRSGQTQKKIANYYGVSSTAICFIKQEKTWKHVPWPEES